MSIEALGTVVGLIFIVLGFAILVRFKKLTSHKYFQILFIIIAIMLLGFGVYMGWRSITLYG
ncbi:MAG: hypothetical protein KDC78_07575 [Aequorivita sp.]|nr:hypothetical protein [Aequorivita sp.]